MPIFTAEQIAELIETSATVPARAAAIIEAYSSHEYVSPAAEEYGLHGFCRRTYALEHCIGRIYSVLPPDLDEIPTQETRQDATLYIQCFIFNVFGALDNLAFVWVNEKNILGANGGPLPNGRIGLTSDKTVVRQSLPLAFLAYLEDCDPWFANLEAFRHSLGHRIPLYILPFTIDPGYIDQYHQLEGDARLALMQHDFAAYEALKAQQAGLCRFRPWMQHSLNAVEMPVVFHPQVLADFATLEQIAQRMLIALAA